MSINIQILIDTPTMSKSKGVEKYGHRYCQWCEGALTLTGRSRKNGVRHHDDWKTRKYHKKCFTDNLRAILETSVYTEVEDPLILLEIEDFLGYGLNEWINGKITNIVIRRNRYGLIKRVDIERTGEKIPPKTSFEEGMRHMFWWWKMKKEYIDPLNEERIDRQIADGKGKRVVVL